MIDKSAVAEVVTKALEGTDLFLVDVTVSPDNCIDVQLDSMTDVTIDDCVRVNDAVLGAFDRDVEDYELTVGSYGISAPFKVQRQYEKNVGGEVEVLTADGKKVQGVLKSVDGTHFVVSVQEKQKLEGKKRPVMVEVDKDFDMNEVKYTKYLLNFK